MCGRKPGRHARREEEDHPKALYRRGTTHALLGNWEEAAADLARALAQEVSGWMSHLMHLLGRALAVPCCVAARARSPGILEMPCLPERGG